MTLTIRFICCIFITSFSASAIADIRILTTEEPPTNYTENGELTGITTEIVIALQDQLGLNHEIEILPWARTYRILKSQPNILAFSGGKTPDREALGFHFIGPVTTRIHSLIARKDSDYKISSFEDIKKLNLTAGTMRQDWREIFLKEKGVTIESATDHYGVIKMLFAGRIQLAVSSDIEGPIVSKKAGIDYSEFKTVYPFQTSSSYLLFSKETPPATVNKWQQAYEQLQTTNFFDDTAKRWSKKLGYQLSYSKDKGFYALPVE